MYFIILFSTAGVTGILPTEIFNQAARPAAYMIAGSLMWLNLFIIGMIFPFIVVSAWSPSWMSSNIRFRWVAQVL